MSGNILTAFYASPWAILPSKHAAIEEAVQRHAAGDHAPAEIVALYAAQNRRPQTSRSGKIAVLPIYGVIAQRMNLIMEASGGTSTELLGKQIDALLDDPEITAIVLDVDSPGGGVEGVGEVAAQIFAARGRKPIIAVANPLMASAAYWIASAADEIVVTATAEVGSIGVFMVHTDRTEQYAKAGVTRSVIRAGKYKAEGVHEPLSVEARAYVQTMVDDVYEQFVAAVAKHRGTSIDAVKNGFGQGRVQLGARAVSSNLADRVGTLDGVIAEITGSATKTVRIAAQAPPPTLAAIAAAVSNAAPEGAAFSHPPSGVQASAGEAALGTHLSLANTPAPVARSLPMPDQDVAANPGAASPTPQVTVGQDRGAAIADLCVLAGVPERAAAMIQSGRSVEQIRGELFEMRRSQAAAPATPPQPQIENYEDGKHSFNLGRAIFAAATNDWKDAGFERTVSNDLQRRINGSELRGVRGTTFYMPTIRKLSDQEREARMQAASHVVGTASLGGNLVFTEYGGFIDLLRARMVCARMGATILPGLQGNVAFPRQTGAGSVYWVAEGLGGTDVTESNTTFDQVSLTPKTAMARQRYSNQLLAQNVINVDAKIRNDLSRIMALAIDKVGLHGGGSNEPVGIYGISGVNTVTFGGAINFPDVVGMEASIEADDADIGELAYVFTPEVKGNAKTTPTFTNTGVPIWTGSASDGELNGHRAMASNQLSKTLANGTDSDAHGGIFGHWPSLLIGEWGGMAITVDPYTLAGIDQVRLIVRSFIDVDVDHPEAFCKAITLTVSA